MKKENFNQKLFLDQLGIDIENNNYKESLEKLHQLCIYNPFRTQQFVQVYINVWCAKILNMLNAFIQIGIELCKSETIRVTPLCNRKA